MGASVLHRATSCRVLIRWVLGRPSTTLVLCLPVLLAVLLLLLLSNALL